MQIAIIFRRGDTKKSVNRIIRDISKDTTKHYIAKGTFAIALSMLNETEDNLLLDPQYFTLSFYQANGALNSGIFTYELNTIPHGSWDGDYPYVSEAFANKIKLSKSVCPKTNDYYISSNYLGDQTSILEILIKKWENTTENNNHWKDDSEINEKMNKHWVQIFVLSTYFDYDDFDNPLKTFVDDQDAYGMNNQLSSYLEIKVQQNKAYLSDNLFYNFNPEEKTYYNVKNRNYRMVDSSLVSNSLMNIVVGLDKESEEYERVVYTFIEMFGFLGGLFDFLFFGGFIFIQFFTENSYLNSVFSKLYQVKVDNYTPIKFTKSSKWDQDKILQTSRSYLNNEDIPSSIQWRISSNTINLSTEVIDDSYIKTLKQELKSRRRYSYDICDNIKQVFKSCVPSSSISKNSKIQKQGLK